MSGAQKLRRAMEPKRVVALFTREVKSTDKNGKEVRTKRYRIKPMN